MSIFFSSQIFAGTIELFDDFAKTNIGNKLEYLADEDRNLTLDDVRSSEFEDRWQEHKNDTPSFDFTDAVYWFRFTVENKSGEDTPYVLNFGYAGLSWATVYHIGENGIIETELGGKEFNKRPLNVPGYAFPLKFNQGRSQVFFKAYSPLHGLQIPAILYEKSSFFSRRLLDNITQGVYAGIILAMVCYNFFLFISVREISYRL